MEIFYWDIIKIAVSFCNHIKYSCFNCWLHSVNCICWKFNSIIFCLITKWYMHILHFLKKRTFNIKLWDIQIGYSFFWPNFPDILIETIALISLLSFLTTVYTVVKVFLDHISKAEFSFGGTNFVGEKLFLIHSFK